MDVIDLSLSATLLTLFAISLASIISSVTGMAGGVLMFSAMNLFIPLRPLIAIHGIVQVFNNATRTWLLRSNVRWSMCLPFALGAIIGAMLTTLVIAQYASEFIPLLLLVSLIFYTLFKPRQLPNLKIKDQNFFWVGIATGSLGILAGAIDPLLAVFFIRDDLDKETVVANKSMMQLITHLTKVPAFIYLGFSFIDNIELIALFSLTAVMATWIGVHLLSKMKDKLFFTLMWWALLLAGVRVAYQLVELV
ncbi:sulfite exporter TauE/SafE family protein [Zooshikella marina]|uniref:sulfite exporter TauE/SafE family protein n=1 Tax=Zooshikella ganghwensis TaxID=202772 RepID=UPI001BAFC988|nr:sulfite exporter TauE/SafE family protein [Zooshikella ganghwensis]MBU2707069.1 sulfite exporter TauE/SafE family protein [Zooshikella ganghwensis]